MSSLLGKEPPDWKDGVACQQCQTKFTLITRKHHCRSCGGVFCSRCSSQTQVLPKFGTQPVRVCDACAKIPPPSPRIDIKPNVSQSPPREDSPLNTSMTRSVFESWIGEEAPKARWVSDPPFSAYGVSPPPGSTPPEFFLDSDMQVKTAKEMEEERERELAELEERKKRKEEKKREKERKRLIEEEKERLRKQQQPEESGGHTPPSENDVTAHLDNSTLLTDSTELPSTPLLGTSQGEPAVSTPPGDNNVSEKVESSDQVVEAAQSGEVGVRQRRTTGRGGSRREPTRPTDQNNRQRTPTVSTGLANKGKELVFAFLAGLIDSFRLKYAFITLFRSKTVYYRARDVFILNVLLLGSYMLFFNVLVPHFDNVLNWKEHKSTTIVVIVSIVNFLLNAIFWLLWLLPLFALSFVLNAHWYQGIAYGSFGLHTFWKKGVKVNADNRSIATVIGEALYRNLIFGAFLGLGYVCYFIPYIGAPLYFVNLCWIYSVYCYEYKWNNQSWGLTRKLEYFETRWIYFAGFGAPIASLSFFLDYFTGYALVSLLFPVFIPIAMYGSPSRQKAWMPIPLSRFVDNSILTPVILFIKNQVTFLDLRNKF